MLIIADGLNKLKEEKKDEENKFLMVALLLMSGIVMAQGGRRAGDKDMNPKARAERMTERMAKEYSLNDTQKKQLLEANLALNELHRIHLIKSLFVVREKRKVKYSIVKDWDYNNPNTGMMADQLIYFEGKEPKDSIGKPSVGFLITTKKVTGRLCYYR